MSAPTRVWRTRQARWWTPKPKPWRWACLDAERSAFYGLPAACPTWRAAMHDAHAHARRHIGHWDPSEGG